MCCKVMQIDALSKPKLEWCPHCSIGKGCNIHSVKPQECADFQCLWLMNENIDDKYKPDRMKVVIYPHVNGYIIADCDQRGSMNDKRNTSLFLELAHMVDSIMGMCLIVCHGNYMKAVTTNGNYDLGETRDTHNIVITRNQFSNAITSVSVAPLPQVSV